MLDLLEAAGVQGVIPPKTNRKEQRVYDEELSTASRLIANFFARLKPFRGLATRYEQRAKTFRGALYRAAVVIWLN